MEGVHSSKIYAIIRKDVTKYFKLTKLFIKQLQITLFISIKYCIQWQTT